MELQCFLVHEIRKERNKEGYFFQFEAGLNIEDANVIALATEIDQQINKSTKKVNGVFTDGRNSSYFSQKVFNCFDADADELYTLAVDVFGGEHNGSLISMMNGETLSTGGFVSLLKYENDGEAFVTVIMLNNQVGRYIDIKDNVPSLIESHQINLRNIDIAVRISIDRLRTEEINDEPHLNFIVAGKSNLYFSTFIGCKNLLTAEKNTRTLVTMVKDVNKSIAESPEELEMLNEKAATYCISRYETREEVDIHSLSKHLYGDENENKLSEYAAQRGIKIDNAFVPQKNLVASLKKVKIKAGWIENLKFDRQYLDNIKIVEGTDDQVLFKNAAELVKKIMEEKY